MRRQEFQDLVIHCSSDPARLLSLGASSTLSRALGKSRRQPVNTKVTTAVVASRVPPERALLAQKKWITALFNYRRDQGKGRKATKLMADADADHKGDRGVGN